MSEIVEEPLVTQEPQEQEDASPAPAEAHTGGSADDGPVTETLYPGREADDEPVTETFQTGSLTEETPSRSRPKAGLAGALGAGGLFTAASSLKGRRPSPRPRDEAGEPSVGDGSAEQGVRRPTDQTADQSPGQTGEQSTETPAGSEVRLKDLLGSPDETSEPAAAGAEPDATAQVGTSHPGPAQAAPQQRPEDPSRDSSRTEAGSGRSFGSRKLVLAGMALVVVASGAGLLVNRMQPVTIAPTGESDDTAATQGGKTHSAIENPTPEYVPRAPAVPAPPAAPGGLPNNAVEPPGEPEAPRLPAASAPEANGAPALPVVPAQPGTRGAPGHSSGPNAGGTLAAPAAPGLPGMLGPMPAKPSAGVARPAVRPGLEQAGARGPAAVRPALIQPSRPSNTRSRSIGRPAHHGGSSDGGSSHRSGDSGYDFSPRTGPTGNAGLIGGLIGGVLN